ncbi:permease [Arthrobacter sp. zg-Y916]|uniref:Permease n=1 Tax=Arthrobacter caoxuetaonis TaxID=2886935 RepID=A0A9X1MCT4_9MICC|nr:MULTISPECIES: FtsX-like permease family protein [Arthrobacter]MCC3296975.1 permease [Arthrobacter caoxuetaonis]MCC9193051.1 permease [Arthrobacter sp. zg-Y916]USQ56214.1 permease [Arthrobacter caoxuetaonis]
MSAQYAPSIVARAASSGWDVPLRIVWLLNRPGTSGRTAGVLPAASFAVVTTLLLTVLAGALSFLQWGDEEGDFYLLLASFALILLVLPLFTLGGSAARLSARRRDEHLSTLRLLGASAQTVRRVAVVEAAVQAFAGAVAGVAGYLVLAPFVALIHFRGAPLGSAYWLHPLAGALAVAAVVILAVVSSVISLRRVVISPLGVRTRSAAQKVHWSRAGIAAAVVGVCILALIIPGAGPVIGIVIIFGVFAAGMSVLNLVGPWLVASSAKWRLRRAKTPQALLAARIVLDAPKAAWRQVSALSMVCFTAVIVGAGAALLQTAQAEGPEDFLLQDVMTGVFITVIAGFLMVACSAGINQAATVLDRAELYRSLDRMGMPRDVIDSARIGAVMQPVLLVSVGSAAVSAALLFPLTGAALLFAPVSMAFLAGSVAAGIGLVRAGLATTGPVLSAVLDGGTD